MVPCWLRWPSEGCPDESLPLFDQAETDFTSVSTDGDVTACQPQTMSPPSVNAAATPKAALK